MLQVTGDVLLDIVIMSEVYAVHVGATPSEREIQESSVKGQIATYK